MLLISTIAWIYALISFSLKVVNGRLRCLGSAQHLKHRFGNGFEVNIKTLSPSDDELVAFLSDLQTRVPSLGATASSQSQSVNPMAAHTNTAG